MAEQTTQEAVAEIWQLFKETDVKFKETDAKIRALEGLFGNQWGRLIEALVQPGVLRLFQERGLQVRRLHQRSKAQRNGDTMEVDLILEDGAEVLVVEVKSTLGVADVDEFLQDLATFTDFFPIYRSYTVYGAVAALTFAESADRYAYRQGLYVVQVVGENSARIVNDNNFRPRDFGKRP
jgi:predicted AAA+ superfamily ATPase